MIGEIVYHRTGIGAKRQDFCDKMNTGLFGFLYGEIVDSVWGSNFFVYEKKLPSHESTVLLKI